MRLRSRTLRPHPLPTAATDVTPTPHGNPMTYLFEEKQYIVLAAGGGNLTGGSQPAQLIPFSLP